MLRIVSFKIAIACTFSAATAQVALKKELQKPKVATINIDPRTQYQKIDNFAASDAWACQFIGTWPDSKKNAIADLLFSRNILPGGKPEGIGLSMWRFNVGAGSSQQGERSGIGDEWRRAESFLESEGKFNWDRQAGQMWFLKAAKERGVQQFLAFTNSPPVQITRNGKAYADSAKANLLPGRFKDYAEYLTAIISNVFKRTGILFNYLSPVNEPQWNWSDGGQEGSPFTNEDIKGIVAALDTAFIEHKLNTKVVVSEAGDYKYLLPVKDKQDKSNQIEAFFSPESASGIRSFSSVERLIAAHSYFTTSPDTKAVALRKDIATKVSSFPGLRLWQSEYCILGNNDGEIKGEKRDLGIDAALYVAKVIHNDLVFANASAWHWWLAISPYDYKDGLIYVDKNKTDGSFYTSKMLWALGNYSRFISPGAVRVQASVDASSPELLASSYLDNVSGELITVVINCGKEAKALKVKSGSLNIKKMHYYITSGSYNLEPRQTMNGRLIAAARSILTITAKLQSD